MLQFIDYKNKLNTVNQKKNLILYGAGTLGKVTLQVLKNLDIEVDFFCDSDVRKHHLKVEGKDIISPEKLVGLDKDTNIFVCNIYFSSIVPFLKNSGFTNIYNSSQLFNDLDVNDFKIANADGKSIMEPLKLKREIDFYNEMSKKEFDQFFRVNDYMTIIQKKEKVQKLKNLFINDEDFKKIIDKVANQFQKEGK